jgi:hypothetical protein
VARERGIPLSKLDDFRRARRRTNAFRAGLAALLVAAFVGALAEARGRAGIEARLLPEDGSAIVVLDLSASMEGQSFRRAAELLRALAVGGRASGLVVFSDIAYELLPPGSPAGEIEHLLRFFEWEAGPQPVHPWVDDFQAGTKISEGLEFARGALVREGVEGGTLVLVSDLDFPSSDVPRLSGVIATLQGTGTDVRIVPLFPVEDKRRYFERTLGEDAFLDDEQLTALDEGRSRRERLGAFPWLFLALAGLLTLGLAANERWCARLVLPPVRRPPERAVDRTLERAA